MSDKRLVVWPLVWLCAFAAASVFAEWIFNANPGPPWLYVVSSYGTTIPGPLFGMSVLIGWMVSAAAFVASLILAAAMIGKQK